MMQTPIAHLKASIHAYNFDSGCLTSLKQTLKGPIIRFENDPLKPCLDSFPNVHLKLVPQAR